MRAVRRELMAADCVPYRAQISEHVVTTALLDCVQVFRLGGASFETIDDDQLNNWHERLNVLWRNIAAPNVALWAHVIRHREPMGIPSDAGLGFADSLSARYHRRLSAETLMVNELYLSVVFRPAAGVGSGWLSRALFNRRGEAAAHALQQALEDCEKLAQAIKAALARYDPQPLGTYRVGPIRYSQLLEFLALLINGEWQRIPLTRLPANQALVSTRLLFGNEAIEYRLPVGSRIAAMLGVKEYSTPCVVGMFNRLLSAPFPFVLTQTFAFLSKPAAQGLLRRQINRMANAGDFAVSQAAELEQALDALTSNEFAFGDHHFSLQVLAELPAGRAEAEYTQAFRSLNDRVALARSLLADTGITVAREDLALEAAFWAQLPGNMSLRTRKAAVSSRNFAAMAAFHNYPSGHATGNHWGEALATLMTSAHSPYYFSLHASDPADPAGGSRKDTGHTFICGPTGSGKTVLIGFLVSTLARRAVTQIIFDKDRGLEILVRALDGTYLSLRNGVATGFNPLQLPATAADIEFLKAWLRCLARAGHGVLDVREQGDLDQALLGTLALEPSARRLSRLIEFLDPTEPEGVHARLSRWCASGGGDYAWVFDNSIDTLALTLSGGATIGFDVTDFIDNATIRTPVTLYLFHLVRRLLDGRRLVCWIDEFWRLLGDPAFESFAKDGPRTWRKLNAAMCFATQSPADVLESSISRTIVEQTPTKVFFPNAAANAEDYIKGFGLSERELRLIKERLEPGSRQFLVKQGHHSIVCQLDLKGFDDALRVISGRAVELPRMQALIERHGSKSAQWLAAFLEQPSERSATTPGADSCSH